MADLNSCPPHIDEDHKEWIVNIFDCLVFAGECLVNGDIAAYNDY